MVTIQPFPDYAVPRIWAWMQRFWKSVADDFAPRSLEEFMAEWERLKPVRTSWGIFRDEELGGVIVVDNLTPVVANIHIIAKQTFWGRETTLEAMKQACAATFEAGLIKIVCTVFPDNASVIHLATQLGAEREGRLKSHTLRGGKPCDLLVFGLTKEMFEKCLSESPQQSPSAEQPQPVEELSKAS